jgi:hypothetical protein
MVIKQRVSLYGNERSHSLEICSRHPSIMNCDGLCPQAADSMLLGEVLSNRCKAILVPTPRVEKRAPFSPFFAGAAHDIRIGTKVLCVTTFLCHGNAPMKKEWSKVDHVQCPPGQAVYTRKLPQIRKNM